MKCPFRTDSENEYMDCYGRDCMAFFEISYPSFGYNELHELIQKNNVVYRCRMIENGGAIPQSDEPQLY